MSLARHAIVLGAVLAGLGVALGAFGAHGLDDYFVTKYADAPAKKIADREVSAPFKALEDYKTGVTYHMLHALGLIGVGLAARSKPSRALDFATLIFLIGILLFSGGLYVLTIAGPRFLGIVWGLVVPFGGVGFLIGWGAFAWGTCGCRESRP